jgi:demethylmenaquinone methyltransferase/2-methoxy-6-polyprenyl-1,4-benzoquinol methylase
MAVARGTTPQGTANEAEASRWVRDMFGSIAPRYDLLNRLLSLNIDQGWRKRTVAVLRPILDRPDARVLDLCCGTGDLTLALARDSRAQVWGSDFCHPMLVRAGEQGVARLFEGDALRLPVADATFDLVTAAFGFRNFANYHQGLAELRRILRPGGTLAILEFSTPPNAVVRAGYAFYSSHVLPAIGGLLSGSRSAYAYLPESVRKFPAAPELAEEMSRAGYDHVRFERMTLGIVALHTGIKRR